MPDRHRPRSALLPPDRRRAALGRRGAASSSIASPTPSRDLSCGITSRASHLLGRDAARDLRWWYEHAHLVNLLPSWERRGLAVPSPSSAFDFLYYWWHRLEPRGELPLPARSSTTRARTTPRRRAAAVRAHELDEPPVLSPARAPRRSHAPFAIIHALSTLYQVLDQPSSSERSAGPSTGS